MKLTKMDKENIELIKLVGKITITPTEANGTYKKRMNSFYKLANNEILWSYIHDDGSMSFELI